MGSGTERISQIETLHREYAGVIYDLCLRILRDRIAAEDAVQETFLSAFRAMDSFTYGDSHLPWLYRIGTNVCLKMLRTASRKGAVPDEHIEKYGSLKPDPARAMHARRVLEQLSRQLDDRSMQILLAHFGGGMSQEEVAQSLGISRRAVVKRLTRLRAIAQELEDADHE